MWCIRVSFKDQWQFGDGITVYWSLNGPQARFINSRTDVGGNSAHISP